MDFTHYTDYCVQTAADLVNTLGHPSGNEYMGTPEELRTFMAEHHMAPPHDADEAELAEVRKVRARLEEVFHAADEAEACRLLNRLLEDYAAKPYLTDHDGKWHFHYAPDNAPASQRLATSTAMGLATVITEFGINRLGVCNADDCGDVYVDMSRNRSRRYCNDLCSTRTNVAAYRARAKAKTN